MAMAEELESDVDMMDFDGDVDDAAEGDTSEFEGFYYEEDFLAVGINPGAPTEAKPGSEEKVMMLAARYASGMPLWHQDDCYDHGPMAAADLLEI